MNSFRGRTEKPGRTTQAGSSYESLPTISESMGPRHEEPKNIPRTARTVAFSKVRSNEHRQRHDDTARYRTLPNRSLLYYRPCARWQAEEISWAVVELVLGMRGSRERIPTRSHPSPFLPPQAPHVFVLGCAIRSRAEGRMRSVTREDVRGETSSPWDERQGWCAVMRRGAAQMRTLRTQMADGGSVVTVLQHAARANGTPHCFLLSTSLCCSVDPKADTKSRLAPSDWPMCDVLLPGPLPILDAHLRAFPFPLGTFALPDSFETAPPSPTIFRSHLITSLQQWLPQVPQLIQPPFHRRSRAGRVQQQVSLGSKTSSIPEIRVRRPVRSPAPGCGYGTTHSAVSPASMVQGLDEAIEPPHATSESGPDRGWPVNVELECSGRRETSNEGPRCAAVNASRKNGALLSTAGFF